jgi:hypothetical protein
MRSFHLCQSATLLWRATSHFLLKKQLRATVSPLMALVCAISFSAVATYAQGAPPDGKKLNVALLDIKTNNLTDNQKIAIVERLYRLIDTHHSCTVIPRVQMLKTLGVKPYATLFACRNLECAAYDASRLRADLFITGDVGLYGESDWNVVLTGLNIRDNLEIRIEEKINLSFSGFLETGLRDVVAKLVAQTEMKKVTQPSPLPTEGKSPAQAERSAYNGKTPLYTPIENASAKPAENLAGKTGDLFISTSEENVSIEIDGIPIEGTTPLTLKNYPAGVHTVTAIKEGKIGVRQISLKPGDLLKVTITMALGKGILKVFTEPVNANVFLDGVNVGQTPLKIDSLSSGTHIVRLEKSGYFKISTNVFVGIDKQTEIADTLIKCAYISVETHEDSAVITINDVQHPLSSLNKLEVPVGGIVIKAEAKDHEAYCDTFSVAQGDEKTVKVKLNSNYGFLNIHSNPEGAKVLINSEEVGSTNVTLRIPKSPEVSIRLIKDLFQTKDTVVAILGDSNTIVSVNLTHTKAYTDSINTAMAQRREVFHNTVHKLFFVKGATFIYGGIERSLQSVFFQQSSYTPIEERKVGLTGISLYGNILNTPFYKTKSPIDLLIGAEYLFSDKKPLRDNATGSIFYYSSSTYGSGGVLLNTLPFLDICCFGGVGLLQEKLSNQDYDLLKPGRSLRFMYFHSAHIQTYLMPGFECFYVLKNKGCHFKLGVFIKKEFTKTWQITSPEIGSFEQINRTSAQLLVRITIGYGRMAKAFSENPNKY